MYLSRAGHHLYSWLPDQQTHLDLGISMKSNVLEESGPAVEGLLDARLDPEPDYISNHCKINQSGRHPLTPD